MSQALIDRLNSVGGVSNPGGDVALQATAPIQITIDQAGTRITFGLNGTVPLANGGTGADLSATGGAHKVVMQTAAGAALAVQALVKADIPNIDESQVINLVSDLGALADAVSALGNYTITCTAPITINGGASANLTGIGSTLAMHVADSTHDGYLAQADWRAFNNGVARDYVDLGPCTVPNPKFINVAMLNIASTGNVDSTYTVPAGRRAAILGVTWYNPTGGSITCGPEVKIGGSYYRLSTFAADAAATMLLQNSVGYIAEAGETLAVNVTATGMNCWFRVLEFDDTAHVKSAKLTTVVAGDNTLYTCPVVGASVLDVNYQQGSGNSGLAWSNNTAGARTAKWFLVPSGGASGSTNQMTPGTSLASNAKGTVSAIFSMGLNDFLVVNVDANTAGQMYWINVVEHA